MLLGKKKRAISAISFVADVVAGAILLVLTYLLLTFYREELESLLSWFLGFQFQIKSVNHLINDGWLFVVILSSLLGALRFSRFYELDVFADGYRVAFASIRGVLMGTAMTALCVYFFNFAVLNRSLLFLFSGLFLVYHLIKEGLYRHYILSRYFVSNPMEALLVCPRVDRDRLKAQFGVGHLSSVRVKDVLETDALDTDEESVRGISDKLRRGRYDLMCVSEKRPDLAQRLLEVSEEQGIELWYLSAVLRPALARVEVDDFGGEPVLVFKTTQHYDGRLGAKRLFDFAITSGLVLVLAPLLLTIAALVKLSSRGPVFFKQERTGWRGRSFVMFKFRTMYEDAEKRRQDVTNEMNGPVFKAARDPRITPVGRFLRRFSLDELPQLFNVLRGEMSLVGPRPLPVYETEQFEAFRDHRRYSVLPGLTGLWQVSGRSEIKDFNEWVRLDLEYIDRWTLWLDIKILMRTVPVVLFGIGAS